VNARLLFCIAMGVFVAHLAVFMIYVRVTMRIEPAPPTPKPTFKFAEEVVADPKTGTKIVNREFTVTTRLAPPGTYKGRPESPANE
jgi:hypothetical protein